MPTAEQSQYSSSSSEEEEEGFTLTAGPSSCTIRTAAVEDASSEEDNITLYSSTHRSLKDSYWTRDSDVKQQQKKRLRIQRKVEDHAPQASSRSKAAGSGAGSSRGKLPLRYNMGKGAKGNK